jgi:TolA-binding protein
LACLVISTYTRNNSTRPNLRRAWSVPFLAGSLAALLASVALPVAAQEPAEQVPTALRRGIAEYSEADFSSALLAFREILLDPDLEALAADAYFWIGKSYLALAQHADAARNFDLYLERYPSHLFTEEARYQRGRLHYLQGDPERSIVALADFVQVYPDSEFAANAYFWIGEALFVVGELDTSREMFTTLVEQFPRSAKVEAARYRTSVIDLRKRETELLRLLKWSHEESLQLSEEFQKRETDLEQAIASSQRRIVALQSGDQAAAQVEHERQVANLEEQLASLRAQLAGAATATAAVAAGEVNPVQAVVGTPSDAEVALTRELLRLKQEALQMQQELRDFVALGEAG